MCAGVTGRYISCVNTVTEPKNVFLSPRNRRCKANWEGLTACKE